MTHQRVECADMYATAARVASGCYQSGISTFALKQASFAACCTLTLSGTAPINAALLQALSTVNNTVATATAKVRLLPFLLCSKVFIARHLTFYVVFCRPLQR